MGSPRLAALVMTAALAAAAPGRSQPARGDDVVESEIERHVLFLGDDALAGRGVGSPGIEQAAAYIAEELGRAGLRWLPDLGGPYQNVPLHASRPEPNAELFLASDCGSGALRVGEDVLIEAGGQEAIIPQATPIVFAGYGIVAPELDYNDYEDLDVAGKIVAVLAGEPYSEDDAYFAGAHPTVHASPAAKERVALSRGARGTLLLPSSLEPDWKTWAYWRRQFELQHVSLAYSVPRHLSVRCSPAAAERLFCGAPASFAEVQALERRHAVHSFPLATRLSFRGEFVERDFVSSNVVAAIEGRDPELREQYVLVSAHYDHLGVGPAVDGDAIYNGVVDNALGVAGTLEIARAIAARATPPRRSIVFLFTTAEEEGLLGASYYVDHPPVPLSRTIANVNIDGLAHLGKFGDVIGIGAELSTLGNVLERVARRAGLVSSPAPPVLARQDAYAYSDQAAFAEGGIPALLVTEGFARSPVGAQAALDRFLEWGRTRYHRPNDDLGQPLDFGSCRDHAALLHDLVLELAESDDEPRWNPGSRFRLVRLRTRAEER